MSGVTITYKITEVFGKSADPTTITLPVPNASPGAPAPNRASFDTGFPVLNFQPITSGGQPPSGKDFNGILYMLSQYAFSMQAGQAIVEYDATTQTAVGGYAVNALLAKASGFGYWLNFTPGNMTDPDTGGAGWSSLTPDPVGVLQLAVPVGTYNDYNPTNFDGSVGFLDITPTGTVVITGIEAGEDGQYLVVTNLSGSQTVTLNTLDGGSMPANQLRLPANLTLVQNNGITLRYSKILGLWVTA